MKAGSALGVLTATMNAVGSVMVLIIMAVILIDVGGRFLFNRPLSGTADIVAMSIAAIVFLQFPSTLRAGRVISADGLLGLVGARSVRGEQWLLACPPRRAAPCSPSYAPTSSRSPLVR